jgi:hypothetical protein
MSPVSGVINHIKRIMFDRTQRKKDDMYAKSANARHGWILRGLASPGVPHVIIWMDGGSQKVGLCMEVELLDPNVLERWERIDGVITSPRAGNRTE